MHASEVIAAPVERDPAAERPGEIVDARGISRSFRSRRALVDVSLGVASGEIHALLGPNGAGKTTLLRILGGLMVPDSGTVSVLGTDATLNPRALRAVVGLVPSGDRTFYLRISGFENLLFFARLHGLRGAAARRRALEVLDAVGLEHVRQIRVGEYSHGMQKRLSVARALLTQPRVMLIDEATHDLDPHGARVVRELVQRIADGGAAVVWATQRIDEIRSFAHGVTLLREGEVCYAGSVARFASRARVTRHIVRLRGRATSEPPDVLALNRLVASAGTVEPASDDPELFFLELSDHASLGDALSALAGDGIDVLACREARSEMEEAFVQLTAGRPA